MQGCDGFQAHVSHLDGSVVVAVTGEIDLATAPHFRAVLEAAATATNRVIVDCDQLTFIDSCGLRELVFASNALAGRGSLTLRNVHEAQMRVLTVTGLADYLTIQERLPTAVENESRP
jgi:anti-anti-sigma factor